MITNHKDQYQQDSGSSLLDYVSQASISRRQMLKLATGTAALAALHACGFGSTTSNRNVSHSFKIASDGPVTALDWDTPVPGAANGFNAMAEKNLYDTLVDYALEPGRNGTRLANSSKFVGQLAQSWSVSSDGRTWTFKLRQGVKSNFGNELTSQDVVWTHQRGTAAKKVYAFFNQVADLPSDGVRAIDRYTVTFTTNKPTALFLASRASHPAGIFDSTEASKHVTPADPSATTFLNANVCGFGPYTVAAWIPGQTITLALRNDYYGNKPFGHTFTRETIPDSSNRLAQLLRGDLDVSENPALDEALKADKSSGTKLISLPAARALRLWVNHSRPPFTDLRVRQALAIAVPYDSILRDIYKGLATPNRSVVPEIIPGSDASGWSYNTDPQKARSLLTSAVGTGSVDISLMIPSTDTLMQQVALAMRTAMAPAGFNINVDQQAPAGLRARLVSGNYQTGMDPTDKGIISDAVYVFQLEFTSKSLSNFGRFYNSDVDSLVDQAAHELDETKRLALLKQAQSIAIKQVATIPILNQNLNVIMRSDVNGFALFPDQFSHFWTLTR